MPREDRYSLSRLVRSLAHHRTATGLEMEKSAELERTVSPDFQKITGGFAVLVPASVFNPSRRDVTAGGSGGALIGLKAEQVSGVLGWSSVVRSGAQMLGPLADSNIRVFHDSNLPSASWSSENAATLPLDVNFASGYF
jgi:hypothetical protein